MPVISVPKEFFVSERNTVYGSWGSAYWRELLSNSIDAGASQIMIRGNFTDDEKFRIDFLDNGKGMSREIVEDVYMRLGESTKKEEDGIGGFGRARILTCFSQESYKIRTRDIVVSGQGASYDIEQSDRTVKGCAITTSMPASDARRLINGLRDVLRQSHLKCSVVLSLPEERPDGGSVPQIDSAHLTDAPNGKKFTGWSHKGRSFRTLSDEKGEWGTAYISNGATAVRHSSIVRVNGMAMYEDHLGVNSQVTIDLRPERAREILTASRDSIRNPFRSELQQLYSEIAADTQSAFRSRGKAPETAITRSAGGNAGFSIGKSKEPIAPIQHQQEGPVSYTSQDQDAAPDDRQTDRRKVGEPYKQETSSRDDPEMRLPFVLHVGNPTSEQRSASNRYKHDAIINNGGIGRTSELLHAAWTAACRHAIEKLIDSNPYVVDAGETWSAGFVFDASMEACHMKAEGVDHALLLNPVDDKGRLQFKISDPASMKRLVSLAIHEVSHIASSWHDERFATTMTNLVGAIRDTEIEKDIREEMDRSRSWIAERAEMSRNEEPSESPAP